MYIYNTDNMSDRVRMHPLHHRLGQRGGQHQTDYLVQSSHDDYLIDLRKLPDGFEICLPRGQPQDYKQFICNPLTGYWLDIAKKGFQQLLGLGLFVSK